MCIFLVAGGGFSWWMAWAVEAYRSKGIRSRDSRLSVGNANNTKGCNDQHGPAITD